MAGPRDASRPAGVRLEIEGRLARLTIDRPPLNILDIAAFESMGESIARLAGDASVDVLVIGSAGDRAFCAGADVADHTTQRAPRMIEAFHRVARALWSHPAVSIAAVRGAALGGGMELAICCDLVVASETARFGQPEIRVGCFPPIAAALLPAMIGRARAAECILTGRTIPASEAWEMGLVSRVAPEGDFDEALSGLIRELMANSGAVMRRAVKAIRSGQTAAMDRALAVTERIYLNDLLALDDAREGVEAFLEKREPRWISEERPDA